MTDKIDENLKKQLLSKIPSNRLGDQKILQMQSFFSSINQIILMVKLYMLMEACIWLDKTTF
jgi:hypothetical protein